MNKERLSRLITQYQKNLEFYRNAREFNEQDCRDEFISPLLESFGWDVHNEKGTSPQYKEVVVEKFSNSGDRPDYTLTLNGVSKIFVEAKKPAVNIKEESEPAIQARRYGWNAKHKLSILTNFEDNIKFKELFVLKQRIVIIYQEIYAPIEQEIKKLLGDLEETIEFQAEMQLMDNDFSNKILSSISQRFAGVFKGKTEANNRITRLLRSTEF